MIKIVNLSLLTKSIPTRFDFVQYSTAPDIGFKIAEMEAVSGMTARIYAQKPSGSKVYSACRIEDGMFVFTPTTQMFAEVGITECQLQITDNGLAHSFLIYANVAENIIDDEAVESQDEFTALQDAIKSLGQYDGRLEYLEDHTVKDNEDGSIAGALSTTGTISSEAGIVANGSYMRISDTGATLNEYETLYFGNASSVAAAYIRAYDGDSAGSAMIIRPGGPLIIGGGEYATARWGLGDITATQETTYIGSDNTIFFESNANTIANRKTWRMVTSGNLHAGATNQGIYGVDSSGAEYPMIKDNGTNLWIGGASSSSAQHVGYTFVSSGYNGTSGNESIFVSVPNSTNTSATNYTVLHTGNYTNYTDYKAGDTYSFTNIICPGFVTNATKNWTFEIITPKLINSLTATVNITSMQGRGVNGYLEGTQYLTPGDYTITVQRRTNSVRVTVSKATAFTNATNNAPCNAEVSGTITFS